MPEITRHAELQWDENGQPVSRQFDDVYFSKANGLEETRFVFLQHNQLAERFAALSDEQPVFTVGETGFGSGLNFLACWQLWHSLAPAHGRLHFITAEKYPLTRDDLKKSLALWPGLAALSDQLIGSYPACLHTGFHRLQFDEGRVQLTLMIGDAAAMFASLTAWTHPTSDGLIDAWFLDGFAPAKNPAMWSDELFAAIGRLNKPGATAATFSAAGIVKRGLRSAGFEVKKVPGFGRKREMVRASLPPPTGTSADPLPSARPPAPLWCYPAQQLSCSERHALVVGGGLAGCHTARALAEKGWKVTLLEGAEQLAAGASGNPQGVVYARLSPRLETLARFNLSCLQFALRHYRTFWQQGLGGSACGVLQLAHTEAEQQWQSGLRDGFTSVPELVQFVDAAQASRLAGIPLRYGGLFFPAAGWIQPAALCQQLTDHPGIERVTSARVTSLEHHRNSWHARTEAGTSWHAPVVVLANASEAQQFAQSRHLPVKTIRGQTSFLATTSVSRALQTVVCAEGYVSPAAPGAGELQHCAGATFSHQDPDLNLRESDHQQNLQHLQAICSDAEAFSMESLRGGRVCFRTTTPDYLPIVGPLPREDAFVEQYAGLRKDARLAVQQRGDFWPGLFVNIGHGSRGLAYTPLCAELLASQINGEALPVDAALMAALHPARFLIRDLQRKRR